MNARAYVSSWPLTILVIIQKRHNKIIERARPVVNTQAPPKFLHISLNLKGKLTHAKRISDVRLAL